MTAPSIVDAAAGFLPVVSRLLDRTDAAVLVSVFAAIGVLLILGSLRAIRA